MKRFLLNGAVYVGAFILARVVLAGILGNMSGQYVEHLGGTAFFIAGMFGHLSVSAFEYAVTVYKRHAVLVN